MLAKKFLAGCKVVVVFFYLVQDQINVMFSHGLVSTLTD